MITQDDKDAALALSWRSEMVNGETSAKKRMRGIGHFDEIR
jgi:hypothetical protein